MNIRYVVYTIGRLLLVLSGVLFVPFCIALYDVRPGSLYAAIHSRTEISGFFVTVPLTLLVGFLLSRSKTPLEIRGNAIREGFAIVTFGWIILTFFGSLPFVSYFMLTESVNHAPTLFHAFTNAYFEIMSGYTTTGASILKDIEVVPNALLFWRSTTHWLGGMGIVTLAVAVFPASGMTAYQMFKGEVPGPTAEKLGPKLRETATILWGVYALLTAVQATLLMFGGMTLFDAICHAFGTLATGGFSTKNLSVGHYNSAYIEWVTILFMFLAGANFILHYNVIFHRNFSVFTKDSEFKFYALVLAISILIITFTLQLQGLSDVDVLAHSFRFVPLSSADLATNLAQETAKITPFFDALRHSAFQVLSVTTTTGFMSADFDMWPNSVRVLLVVLMFFGGCAGSTSGGIKMIRLLTTFKMVGRELKRITHPRLVESVKIAGRPVSDLQISNIAAFIIIFMMLFIILTFFMSFYIPDFTTASTAVVASLCNVGPGLSGVGATQNWEWIPLGGKWIAIAAMLLGRLELFTVIIAFSPTSWKR